MFAGCASPGLHPTLPWADILPVERGGLEEPLLAISGSWKKLGSASDERAGNEQSVSQEAEIGFSTATGFL